MNKRYKVYEIEESGNPRQIASFDSELHGHCYVAGMRSRILVDGVIIGGTGLVSPVVEEWFDGIDLDEVRGELCDECVEALECRV